VPATEIVSVAELRSNRRALRAERARAARWRRLVSARIDLAVASAAPPEELGVDLTLLLHGVVHTPPPAREDLNRVLRQGLPISEIRHLGLLRQLDEQLASYQRDLDAVLAATTSRFIDRLIVDPRAALDELGPARSRR
jgi:hypothetical protein